MGSTGVAAILQNTRNSDRVLTVLARVLNEINAIPHNDRSKLQKLLAQRIARTLLAVTQHCQILTPAMEGNSALRDVRACAWTDECW